MYNRAIVWTDFGVLLSCLLLSLIIVGGIGNPVGAVVGGIIVGPSLEIIRRVLTSTGLPQNTRYLFFAGLLVLAVRFRPQGLFPDRPSWFARTLKAEVSPVPRSSEESNSSLQASRLVLEVSAARKSFGGIQALGGLDLRVGRGECVALIGPIGSGKTTLMNAIGGLLTLDSGEIILNGRTVERMAAHTIARLGVGRSFQDPSVFDDLDVADNLYVTMPHYAKGEIVSSLSRFGLNDTGLSCHDLSYGQRKSLDLARALVSPEIGLDLPNNAEPHSRCQLGFPRA